MGEYHRQWYLKNKERVLAMQKARKEKYPERVREIRRKTKLKRKEHNAEYNRQWYKENREHVLKRSKEYASMRRKQYNAYVEKHREKIAQAAGMTNGQIIYALKKLKQSISPKMCQICGSTEMLELHHILPRKQFPKLVLSPNNIILLCRKHHREAEGKHG